MRQTKVVWSMAVVCALSGGMSRAAGEKWGVQLSQHARLRPGETFKQAEDRLMQALAKAESEDKEMLLRANQDLGVLYWHSGAYFKAIPVYRKALELSESVPEFGLAPRAVLMNNLGVLYRETGWYDLSRQMHETALQFVQRLPPEDAPLLGETYFAMGMLEFALNHYAKAESWYDRAAPILQKYPAKEAWEYTRLLDAYTRLYSMTGDIRKADLSNQRCWKLLDRTLPADSIERVSFMDTRATLLFQMERYTDAEKLWTDALRFAESQKQGEDPSVQSVVSHLAEFYVVMGQPDKAEPLMARSKEFLERREGPHSTNAAVCKGEMGLLYTRTHRLDKAKSAFEESLATLDSPGANRPMELAMVLNYYAEMFASQGKWKEAYDNYRRSLEIREKLLGDNPLLLTSLRLCEYSARKAKFKKDAKEYGARAEQMEARRKNTELPIQTVDVKTLQAANNGRNGLVDNHR